MAPSVEINCRNNSHLNSHTKDKLFFPPSDIKISNGQDKKKCEKPREVEERTRTYRAEKQFCEYESELEKGILKMCAKTVLDTTPHLIRVVLMKREGKSNEDPVLACLGFPLKASRKEEAAAIRNKFPTKIPIIVDRFHKESSLPPLERSKFLVPQEITMSQFVTIIRNRMKLGSNQAFYLLINNRSMLSLSKTLAEVYNDHKEEDGFLYMTYASQEVFG